MIQFINDYIHAAVGAYEFNTLAVVPFLLLPIVASLPVVFGLLYIGFIKSVKR